MFTSAFGAARLAFLGLAMALIPAVAIAADTPLKVLVVDQQAILRDSLAGQDIGRQAAQLRDQIEGEVKAEQDAIVKSEDDLNKNAQLYSPAQRDAKLNALNARKQAYPMFEQRKSQVLQLSINRASQQIVEALRPILQALIDENHATLLLDKGQVMYAAPSYDVTQEAIRRLNNALKTVKVVRVNLDSASSAQQGGQGVAPVGQADPSSPIANSH